MTDRTDVDEFDKFTSELVRRAQADLETILAKLHLDDPRKAKQALTEAMDAIVTRYGSIGATAAAEWYDKLREEAKTLGQFTALAADVPSRTQIRKATSYAVNEGIRKGDIAITKQLLLSAMDRLVKKPARDTIVESGKKDPAKPRWARIPTGHACAFCRMNASRGFVYASKRTAGGEGNKYHDDCHCVPTPSWDKDPQIEGYDPDTYMQEYLAATDEAGNHDTDKVLAAMRQGTDENASHYKPQRPAHPDDDPKWTPGEKAIADYLRGAPTYRVTAGGQTDGMRLYDFTLDDYIPAEGKNLISSSDSGAMRNEATASVKRGGQARILIFDVRATLMDETEARRGGNRIRGLFGAKGTEGHKLDTIIVIGNDFYLEETL